jgi:hypothetical protein
MTGDNSDRVRAFLCPHCEKPATAQPRGVADWNGRDSDGEIVDTPTEWMLVQCSRCAMPTLEMRESIHEGWEYDDPAVVYPAPHRISPVVPRALRQEWAEAQSCFDAKAYTACLVMVRRTLEGTCLDQGVKTGTLAKSLRELKDRGLIDGTLAEWADALRIAGNRGAHFTGTTVPREDAEDALAFAEALLDHIYVLRKRFEEFQQRLKKK